MILIASEYPSNNLSLSALKLGLDTAGITFECTEEPGDIEGMLTDYPGIELVIIHAVWGADLVNTVKALRANTFTVPVIVLSDMDSPRKAHVIEAGADDAWEAVPPAREFAARVRGAVRRGQGVATPILRCGPITLDETNRVFKIDGVPVHLTKKLLDLMAILMKRPGITVSKDRIYNQLYSIGDPTAEPKIVDVFICKLRAVLRHHGNPGLIGTTWGVGYFLSEEPNESGSWADSQDKGPTHSQRLLAFLSQHENGRTPTQIIEHLGCEPDRGRTVIHLTMREGHIYNAGGSKPGSALYRITEDGRTQLADEETKAA